MAIILNPRSLHVPMDTPEDIGRKEKILVYTVLCIPIGLSLGLIIGSVYMILTFDDPFFIGFSFLMFIFGVLGLKLMLHGIRGIASGPDSSEPSPERIIQVKMNYFQVLALLAFITSCLTIHYIFHPDGSAIDWVAIPVLFFASIHMMRESYRHWKEYREAKDEGSKDEQ